MSNQQLKAKFRCEKFACTVAHRICLMRQTEQKRIPSSGRMVPKHDYCGTGECQQGKEIAARFEGWQAPAPRDPRAAPRLDIITKVEGQMMEKATAKRKKCDGCGSTSRHRASCSKRGKGAAPREKLPRTPSSDTALLDRKPPSDTPLLERLAKMPTESLLTLRSCIDVEIQDRVQRQEQELARLRAALPAQASAA